MKEKQQKEKKDLAKNYMKNLEENIMYTIYLNILEINKILCYHSKSNFLLSKYFFQKENYF